MDRLAKAREVLSATEAQLKDIVRDALSSGEYADVAAIAALAKSVSELCRSLIEQSESNETIPTDSEHAPGTTEKLSPPNDEPAARPVNRTSGYEKLNYPRFERHARKLVKLGWSSKDRRIYEQRASYETVEEICRRFIEKSGSRRMLRVEKLLPMKTDSGDEIPSYQVYLVLKWLQQHSVVERQGKEGYLVAQVDFDLKSLWERTPTR